jgi:hypothetical protein
LSRALSFLFSLSPASANTALSSGSRIIPLCLQQIDKSMRFGLHKSIPGIGRLFGRRGNIPFRET